jgi:hypothetical protein
LACWSPGACSFFPSRRFQEPIAEPGRETAPHQVLQAGDRGQCRRGVLRRGDRERGAGGGAEHALCGVSDQAQAAALHQTVRSRRLPRTPPGLVWSCSYSCCQQRLGLPFFGRTALMGGFPVYADLVQMLQRETISRPSSGGPKFIGRS